MKKRMLSLILTACMLLGMLPGTAGAEETAEAWDGTAITAITETDENGNPGTGFYIVKTGAELAWVAQRVNANTEYSSIFKGKTLRLANDIDLGGQPWTPIGDGKDYHRFDGTFDGGGYTVSGLAVGTEASPFVGEYAGLFGYINLGRDISNVTVKGSVYTSGTTQVSFAGLLAGAISCPQVGDYTLRNCHAVGSVKAVTTTDLSNPLYLGGLVGLTKYVVDGCSARSADENPATALVTHTMSNSSKTRPAYLGGLAGKLTSYKAYNSFAIGGVSFSGTATSASSQKLGGLFGATAENSNVLLQNCFARANVTGGADYVSWGSLTTTATDDIKNSYFAGVLGAGTTDSYTLYKTARNDTANTAQSIKDYFNDAFNAASKAANSVRPRPLMMGKWVTNSDNGGLPALTDAEFVPDWVDEGLTAVSPRDYVEDTANNTITINTATGLGWLSANFKTGKNKTILLSNDINLTGKQWVPLGAKLTESTYSDTFGGMFDGQGHTITGMTIGTQITPMTQRAGLIAFAGKESTIMNLGLTGAVYANTEYDVGGVVGENRGKIINCYSEVAAVNSHTDGTAGPMVGQGSTGYIVNSFSADATGGQYFGNAYGSDGGQAKTADQLKDAAFATLLNTTAQSLTDQRPAACSRSLYGWKAVTDSTPAYNAVLTKTLDWVDVANGAGGEAAASGTDYVVDGNTYTIKTAKGLGWLAGVSLGAITQDAPSDRTFEEITVVLDDDINLSGHNWVPIGSYLGRDKDYSFSGTFDGRGHKITGLTINNNMGANEAMDAFSAVGLFGVTYDAIIKNVTIHNPAIVAANDNLMMGALIGRKINGVVDNCHVIGGTISGTGDWAMNIGGLVGYNQGCVILNSSAATALSMSFAGGEPEREGFQSLRDKNLGGIVGSTAHDEENSCVLNCYSRSTLTVLDGNPAGDNAAWYAVGGIAGQAIKENILNNYFAGSISVPNTLDTVDPMAGGVVGYDGNATISNNFYLTGTTGKGVGNAVADDAAKAAVKTADELKALSVTLNAPAAIGAVNTAVAPLAGKLAALYWKADGVINDGYPVHKTPESFTKQPTTASLSVEVTSPTGAAYQWEKQMKASEPYEKDKWEYDTTNQLWKTITSLQYGASMEGYIDSDSEGKITFQWAAKVAMSPDLNVEIYDINGDKVAFKSLSTANETLTSVTLQNEKIKPNTTYIVSASFFANGDTSRYAKIKFSDSQPMYNMAWQPISGQVAATLTPTGIAKDTLVRCIATYPWGETLTSDSAKVGEAPASCTCTVSAPTFTGGSIDIAHNAASATQALSATGSTLSGSCAVPDHATAAVTYTYAEKTDVSNIASITGTTLTVTGAGTVVVTATATANGKSASVDATFTVTKADPPVVTYTVTFDSQSATTEANPTSKTAVSGGNVGSLPTEPVKTGYTFGGWFTQANGGGSEFKADTTVTADIIVYAKWIDATAPTLTAGAVSRTSDAAATVKFTSDEAGSYYYKVGGAVTDTTGTGVSCGTTEVTLRLAGLSAGAKDVYIVVKDAAGNVSANTFKITIPAFLSDAKWGTDDTYAVGSGSIENAVSYANSLGSGTAYIQLQKDVSCTGTIEFNADKTTVLDLNGCTLAGNHVFSIIAVTGNLTMKDSGASGAVITGPTPTYSGSGVSVSGDGHFTLEGGKIGPTLRSGVSVNPNIDGVHHAKFTMTGGSISGNKWQGVVLGTNSIDSSATFTMSGGEITGNNTPNANEGGGVTFAIKEAVVNLSGSAKITGNVKNGTLNAETGLYTGGTPCNLYLGNGRMPGGGTFSAGASIGVTVANPPTTGERQITQIAGTVDNTAFFTSDDPAYEVFNIVADSKQDVYLRKQPAPVTEAEWTPTDGVKASGTFAAALTAMNTKGGSIKLLTDVATADSTILPAKTVSLDLNGQTWSSGSEVRVIYGGTLNLLDTGGGKILNAGAPVTVQSGGTLNLSGGTIENSKDIGYSALSNSGTVVMSGGKIVRSGRNIAAVDNKGTFSMTGGEITCAMGKGVDNKGTFSMTGGTIMAKGYGVVIQSSSAKVYLGGTASITSRDYAAVHNSNILYLFGTPILTKGGGNDTYQISCDGGTIVASNGKSGGELAYYTGGELSISYDNIDSANKVLVSGIENEVQSEKFNITISNNKLEPIYNNNDKTIIAKGKTYTITYKDRAKAEDGAAFSGTHGGNYPTTYTAGTGVTLVDPTKANYTFGGWYAYAWGSTDEAVTELSSGASGNRTFYAKWIPNNITAKTATPDLENTIDAANSYNDAYFELKPGAEYQEQVEYKLYTTATGMDKAAGITAADDYGDSIIISPVTVSDDYWLSATEDGKLESDRVKISVRPEYSGLDSEGYLTITNPQELAAYLNYCEPDSAVVNGTTVTQSKDVHSLYTIYFAGNFEGVWDLGGKAVRPSGNTAIYLFAPDEDYPEYSHAENVKLTVKNGTISGNESAISIEAGTVILERVALNAYERPIDCRKGTLTMTDVTATVKAMEGAEDDFGTQSIVLYTTPLANITIHSGKLVNEYPNGMTYYSSADEQTPGKKLSACIPATSSSVPADSVSMDDDGATYELCTETVTVTKNGGQPVPTYTVTYDGNGNTAGAVPMDNGNYKAGVAVTVLGNTGALTKENHVFSGWNTAANGSGTTYVPGGRFTISASTTLYAKWTEVFHVGGDITDNGGNKVAGAQVTIKLGNTQMGNAVTDVDGAFTIAGIPSGVYQLIITSDDLTVTRTITVAGSDLAVGTVKLPAGKQNSVVVVEPNTPDIVVGGLDEQFEIPPVTEPNQGITQADKDVLAASGAVEIKLTVESKTDSALNAEDIKQAAGGKTLSFLDLSVVKTVTPSGGSATETPLTELQKLLEVRIPLADTQQGKTDYTIYRYHGSKVDTITTTANADGEKLELIDGGKTLLLWTKKFSTYAVAYNEPTPPPVDTGSGVTTYTITATAGEGGAISPKGTLRVNRNADKTFTITPNAGYEIADVLVDGKSVLATVTLNGGEGSYTFEKVTAKHTIEASFRKEVKNPFTDVTEDDWFHNAVQDMLEKGIMEGTAADKFSPYLNTDRATVVTVLWRMAGRPAPKAEVTFPDVPAGAWYAQAVAWGTETGIVKGYDTGKFGPGDPVTREQLAALLWRYSESPVLLDYEGLTRFEDTERISGYAAHAVTWAVAQGILTGKDSVTLDPTGSATRAEVAAMLMRLTAKKTESESK